MATKKNTNKETTSKKLIVWLKARSYVSPEGEPLERWSSGIYKLSKLPKRLQGQPENILEVFEGEVPARKLMEMAEFCGIQHPEDYEDNELLERMVSEEPKRV